MYQQVVHHNHHHQPHHAHHGTHSTSTSTTSHTQHHIVTHHDISVKSLAAHLPHLPHPTFPHHTIHAHLRQSPIDIRTNDVICDTSKCGHLEFHYHKGDCEELLIKDGVFKVTARKKCTSTLAASHLPGIYRFLQFHAHWGGSEHTLNGERFDGELHFVFWNTMYKTPEDATQHPDGLAVLGVFVKQGAENKAFEVLVRAIEKCHTGHETVKMPITFDPHHLIPHHGLAKYFTYQGGLTTPPYTECVIWTILEKPITLSEKELSFLKTLKPKCFRECQKLCARKVYSTRL